MSPESLRELEVDPQFVEKLQAETRRISRRFCLCSAVLMLSLAPVDLLVKTSGTRTLLLERLAIVVVTIGYLCMPRRLEAWLGVRICAAVVAALAAMIVGASAGVLSNTDPSWFMAIYASPVFCAGVFVSFWRRVAHCVALSVAVLLAFHSTFHGQLSVAYRLHVLALFIAAAFFAVFVVHLIYLGVAENFLLHRKLESRAQELDRFRATLEVTVAERTTELRLLASHLAEVIEEQQRHVGRELHDDVGQELTGMRLEADVLAKISVGSDAKEHSQKLVDAVTRLHDSLSRIVGSLRPRVLEDRGLVASIEWLIDNLGRVDPDIVCVLTAKVEATLDPAVALVAFRVAQEALNNVARHAGAAKVSVQLTERENHLLLTIEDDGDGLPMPLPKRGHGLLGIRERAMSIGGTVKIENRETKGTRIAAKLPMDVSDEVQ